jgi:hypothetical protein
MDDRTGFRLTPRLIVGFFIALAGALLLLDNLGLADSRHFFRFWPVALIALGIARVLQPHRYRQRGGGRGFGFVLIFAGTWLLLTRLGLADLDTDLLWPALILLLGLNLLWREISRRGSVDSGTDPRERTDSFAMLGSAQQVSGSQAFRGGTATAILGSCEIDLRRSLLAEQGALIDAFAMWGGVDILVPEDWEVVIEGTPILGSVEDKTQHLAAPGAPVLVVRGFALMGGIEVRNRSKGES